MYSKGDIGKKSSVVNQSCNYKCTTAFGIWKNTLVNYSNFLKKIVVYCTYSNGDIGKPSRVVSQSGL